MYSFVDHVHCVSSGEDLQSCYVLPPSARSAKWRVPPPQACKRSQEQPPVYLRGGTPNLPTKIIPTKMSTQDFRGIPYGHENCTP